MKDTIYKLAVQFLEMHRVPTAQMSDTYRTAGALANDIGLLVSVEVNVDNYGYLADGNTHVPAREAHFFKVLHFIITRNRRVYMTTTDLISAPVHPEDFVNLSNHDSCWVEGLNEIHKVEYSGYEACFLHVGIPEPERSSQENCYNNHRSSINTKFLRNRDIVRFVRIERGPHDDPNEVKRGYLDAIKSIHDLGFTVGLHSRTRIN